MSETVNDPEIVRLSVNLHPEVAAILRRWAAHNNISATEAVRRAIAVWDLVESTYARGDRIGIIEGRGRNEMLREVVYRR